MQLQDKSKLSLVLRAGMLAALAFAIAAAAYGCDDVGGKEGDRCNALVLRDECDPGLACKAATCSESYCCPNDRTSSDPNCNAPGCPDEDAGDGGDEAADASEAASEAGPDASADAPLDTGPDARDGGSD